MRKPRRLSDEAAAVLSLFVRDPDRPLYGREVIRRTSVRSGSLYPILHRFEQHQLLRAEWETIGDAVEAGVRPRRYYTLHPEGAERARIALAEWNANHQGHRPAAKVRPATS